MLMIYEHDAPRQYTGMNDVAVSIAIQVFTNYYYQTPEGLDFYHCCAHIALSIDLYSQLTIPLSVLATPLSTLEHVFQILAEIKICKLMFYLLQLYP